MTLHDPNPYASPSLPQEPPSLSAPVEGTIDALLATRWQRFLGSLIDGLILLAVILPLSFAFGLGLVVAEIDPAVLESGFAEALVGLLIGGGAFVAIHGYLLATRGQTVGKYFLHTQIVSDEGRLVPLWRLIATRYLPIWLVSVIPGIGGLLGLANALAIFRESRKCFHDDLAGTKVIQLNRF